MSYTILQISAIVKGEAILNNNEAVIEHLLVDSRKLVFPANTLFFAIKTERRDGAAFIPELYERGVRNFITATNIDTENYKEANFLVVPDVVRALQEIAAFHRSQFSYPVIGITGSNGKTIVKEWLNQLLQQDHYIIRSPKSYNSQIGVPLSVWQMKKEHALAIFEAGISRPGEMALLQKVIQPTIGILTNIGEAHSEGFISAAQKAFEKAMLFSNTKILVYAKDKVEPSLFPGKLKGELLPHTLQCFSWSNSEGASFVIKSEEQIGDGTVIKAEITSSNEAVEFTIPFTDTISIQNAITCYCIMLVLGYSPQQVASRMKLLSSVEMRMQLKKGVNNCIVINDSYSNDLSSLQLALEYLRQQQGNRKATAIVSEIIQSGLGADELFQAIKKEITGRKIERLILVGPSLFRQKNNYRAIDSTGQTSIEFYPSTDAFLQESNTHHFRDEVILLKGARIFEFERISRWLEEKVHQTVMEINLDAMVQNLKQYQSRLSPNTKVMAMVKAFSYGSGSAEVANILQFNKVDYLAVAYADEGVELRKAGIHMPIMVMNPEEVTFDALVEYDLEPEIYSFNILHAFNNYLAAQALSSFPVHIKIDTGMHRLGFEVQDVDELIQGINRKGRLVIQSVFSHLVASEDEQMDEFTRLQYYYFNNACDKISNAVGYPFTRHLSNSAAIFRHPDLQLDMVRLGIGLYGVDSANAHQLELLPVATLTSTIAQIRKVKAGESVGYNRKGVVHKDSTIATVRLGYADGFSRRLGNGNGKMSVKGILAPVIGNVCMDMTMIDITGIEGVKEGDRVEIFGHSLPVQDVASWAGTIPYEIMTGISQRVKRVYFQE